MTGPERSVMTEADTTNAAVIAMRKSRIRRKESSEDIYMSSLRTQGPIRAAYRLKTRCSTAFASHDRLWLWVPARASLGRDDSSSYPLHRHRDFRAIPDGLIHHAIALGELEQQVELVLRRIGIELEAQADRES